MCENSYSVYMHTNKSNGKRYVGITFNEPAKRWGNGNSYRRCPLFSRAINKYGWDNFVHEILFENLSKEDAERKEIELIAFYNSNNPKCGYNIANGGDHAGKCSDATKLKMSENRKGRTFSDEYKELKRIQMKGESNPFYGKHHTEETKDKIRQVHIGKKLSEETKQKMSIRGTGSGNNFYGRTHSDESKKKMSEARKKYSGANHPCVNPVIQYDLDGNFIRKWDYIKQVQEELGIFSSAISSCCRGKIKTAYGYKWEYA